MNKYEVLRKEVLSGYCERSTWLVGYFFGWKIVEMWGTNLNLSKLVVIKSRFVWKFVKESELFVGVNCLYLLNNTRPLDWGLLLDDLKSLWMDKNIVLLYFYHEGWVYELNYLFSLLELNKKQTFSLFAKEWAVFFLKQILAHKLCVLNSIKESVKKKNGEINSIS